MRLIYEKESCIEIWGLLLPYGMGVFVDGDQEEEKKGQGSVCEWWAVVYVAPPVSASMFVCVWVGG